MRRYDCVVVGAGPAGCATAAIVAQHGLSTLLVEREKMPRFHVGESLMPETFWTLERIGVLDRMRQSPFVTKVGVQFVSPSGSESQPFFFNQHDPRECSRTWHVERADFDQMLFENAAEKGTTCRDETRVTELRIGAKPPHSLQLRHADGSESTVEARVVVDATGQQALLANRLGLLVPNPDLRKAAIWGHFANAKRNAEGTWEVTSILYGRGKRSWFWYIPLSDNKVSVGLVSDNDYLLRGRGTAEEVFWDEAAGCPGLMDRLADAQRPERLLVAREFSYSTRQHAGEGWVLVGDAFGFIDPIYSTGVLLALRSGELAADAIVDGLRQNDTSARQLGRWTADFKTGVERFRTLVQAFYTPAFSFAEFVHQHPSHKGPLTDLLIGHGFTEQTDPMLADLNVGLSGSS